MDKKLKGSNFKKAEYKTTVLRKAEGNSYWDAETEVIIGKNVKKIHMRVYSISKLLEKCAT
jgi:hypothetical protein